MKVLIAHGSERGGTAEIAARIGERLRESGFTVDVMAAREVRDLLSYDAVVIGGALYMFRWHAEARELLLRHVAALRARQVWLFSSGPLDDSASAREIPPIPEVDELMAHIGARGHHTFGGRLTPDAKGRMAANMAKEHAGDWRAPDRIDAWARVLAEGLRADPQPARPPFRPLRSRLPIVALCLVAGVPALISGALLVARPDGSLIGLSPSLLARSPFSDYLVPGLVLFTMVGIVDTWAAWLHVRRHGGAPFVSLLGGVALIGWIVVQMLLFRSFAPLQVSYLVVGLVLFALSLRQVRRLFPPGTTASPPQPARPMAGRA